MKYLKIEILSTLILICISGFIAKSMESRNDYNAACRMSDVIRCFMDSMEDSTQMPDKASLEEICSIFLWDDAVGPYIKLEDYSYYY